MTPLNLRQGHARRMAAVPSIVDFGLRLRAAFVLHDYVSIVRHQIQEYIYETPLPTRSKCAMFRQHSLWIGNSVVKKRGRSPSKVPLWFVGEHDDSLNVDDQRDKLPLGKEACCLSSERGLPWRLEPAP